MLNTLRKGAATWVAKIFIGLLVLSFAVWGIADIFTGYGQRVLAKVGDVEIPPQQYERLLQQQIRRLSAQFGQPISNDQARAFGLDRQVLNSLITNAAVDQQAAQLNLGITDANIRDEILKIPAFQGADGKFDRNQFNQVLNNNNMNEAMFVAEQRVGAVRSQLVSTVSSGIVVPDELQQILNRYDNDQRIIDFFVLPRTAAGKIADPDQPAMEKFLESNKRMFTAPEYRKTGVLTLNLEQVRKGITITDEDIANDYKAREDQFTTPGKRQILRMSFIDRNKAIEAKKELDGGADFMQVAEKYGFKKDGTDMGMVNKTAFVEPRIADVAFALELNQTSDLLKGALSTMILKVVKIDPNQVKRKLADVKDEIRTYLLNERALEKITTLQDSIEDERAGGLPLKDIAKNMELSYKVVEAVDRNGKAPDGKAVETVADIGSMISGIFASDVGVENDPVEAGGDTFYWYEVLGVTPERLKKLDEVKADLIKSWKRRETEKQMAKKSADILAALKTGKSLAEMVKPYKAEIKKTKPFSRSEEHDDIPQATVNQAFALALDDYGMNSLPGDKGRIIFKVVKKIDAAKPDEDKRKKLSQRLRAQLENDVVSQYIAGLRSNYGVTINQQVLDRLNGTTQ